MTNCGERPQTLAFFAFSLLLFAADARWCRWKYWAMAVPLLLVWQNVHPSAAVAAGVMTVRAAGRWLDERSGREAVTGMWRRPLATACVAGVAVFCTPAGLSVLELGARNADVSRWLGIGEWLPAHAMLPATAGFWCLLASGALVWLRFRTKLPWAELLPIVLLTGAAVWWTRMIVFWALASGPTVARLLGDAVGEFAGGSRRPGLERLGPRCRSGVVVAAALALVIACPWVRPRAPVLPESRRALFDPQLPFAGVDALARVMPCGRVYNYREWGGILAQAGPPEWQIAIDGRVYRYDYRDWRSYVKVALGLEEAIAVLDRERPDALFLRPSHDHRLIERLQRDPQWYDYYSDRNCHIFLSRHNVVARAD
jgi:hypothetical protein